MYTDASAGAGKRIAYQRRLARLTQQELARTAGVALGTARKIERGERGVGEGVSDAIAAALGIDVACLLPGRDRADDRVHRAMPELSAVLATYDMPEDGPTRPLSQLREAVAEVVTWRLAAQYVHISRQVPGLLAELGRAFHGAPTKCRADTAELLVAAYRAADAVAYKYGAYDLSARLIDLMRWAAAQSENPLLEAAAAYTRTEMYFAAGAHAIGLRALERALDVLPRRPVCPVAVATRGALHMRAAVIAARAGEEGVAFAHAAEARSLAARVPEATYQARGSVRRPCVCTSCPWRSAWATDSYAVPSTQSAAGSTERARRGTPIGFLHRTGPRPTLVGSARPGLRFPADRTAHRSSAHP